MPIKIFIDQGHNPVNPNAGSEGNGYREQDITYRIGVDLAALLNANPQFSARLSRQNSTELLGTTNTTSLSARTNAANAWGADYFISLHTNAAASSQATGTEAFVYSTVTPAYELAQEIVKKISEDAGLVNRGVFVRPGLYVLKRTAMPAVLVEMGFITNARDARLMATQPQLFANAIYQGILEYFGL